jgi:Tfp pilus assembly protein PilV
MEVLISVAILSVGILALTKLQIFSIKSTDFNKGAMSAIVLAQGIIEDFKAAAYGAIPERCGSTVNNMQIACTSVLQGDSPYSYEEITVTVSWDSPIKKICLNTALAEK